MDRTVRGTIPTEAARGAADLAGREWVVDQVRDWAEKGTERFLFLVGEPGWGKSALAAWLVSAEAPDGNQPPASDAARPVKWSAWHFCVSAQGRTINPQQFAASLSVQLASRLADYGYAIVKRAAPEYRVEVSAETAYAPVTGIVTRAIIINARDAREVYDQAVREPLEAVVAGGMGDPIFILVDGLDDGLAFSSPNIVDLLATAGDFPASVRFLLTTRKESRVLGKFRDSSQYRMVYVSDPDDPTTAARNEADVREYVAARLAEPVVAEKLAPGTAGPLTDSLVELANGNFLVARFLLEHVATLGTLPEGVPGGLYPLYDDYLGRLMPETDEPGISNRWTDKYQPVLGTLSVARPAAPTKLMPLWLQSDQGELNPTLNAVGQVVEYLDEDGGSRRLYHRSLAEFLAIPDLPGPLEPEPNRYFVEPREQHRRIAAFYLAAIADKDRWNGDWSKSDAYGLRQLVYHLGELFRMTPDGSERARIAEQLASIALDHGYQAAQQQALGDAVATVEACRLALEVSIDLGDIDKICEHARKMAESQEPEIRILAARVLERVSGSSPDVVLGQLKSLVV